MADGFFDNAVQLVDPDDGRDYIAIAFFQDFKKTNPDMKKTTVQTTEVFRADKISFRLYQTSDLAWVLDTVNNFEHEFKEYTLGTEILYPAPIVLQNLGLI